MNARPSSPAEVLTGMLAAAGADLHVACPAEVVAWNATTRRADCQPLVKTRYEDETGTIQATKPPVVCNCAVVFPEQSAWLVLKNYLDALKTALDSHTHDAGTYTTPSGAVTLVSGAPTLEPPAGSAFPSVPSGASLVLPVAKGDTGLLIFCDSSLDVWLARGGLVDPLDDRHHSLSDAVFIPGLRPFSSPITVPT